MLSVGPVAEQLGHSFDQYWNSALSKPIDDFVSNKPSVDLAVARGRLEASSPNPVSRTTRCITACARTRPNPAWTSGAAS